MPRSSIQNQILLRLTLEDFLALKPFLEPVTLDIQQDVIVPGKVIEHVIFVESGMCSLTAASEGSEPIEVGLVGREGMSDHVMVVGDTSALRCFAQVRCSALMAPAAAYADWVASRPNAMQLMFRYQQYMTAQVSFTALSHGSYTIEERLARLLLMSFDRNDGDDLPLVHEFMSTMLAVRRAGVTNAIHVLEGHGAVKSTRGNIRLRDRSVLEILAAGSYGVPEAEYQRLMGPLPPR